MVKVLRDVPVVPVSYTHLEWLDRYGYTDGYYRSGLLPAYMGISCAGLAVIFLILSLIHI